MENFFNASQRIGHTGKRIQNSESDLKRSNLATAFHYLSEDLEKKRISELRGRFTIVWLKSGSLSLRQHGQIIEIQANRLFCLLPDDHIHLLAGHHIDAYLVSFSEDFLLMAGVQETYPFSLHYADGHISIPIVEAGDGMREGIENVMKLVIRNIDPDCHFETEIFKGMLQIFAVYFSRSSEKTPHSEFIPGCDEFLFSSFIKMLDTHYVTKKSVNEYARALTVSPGYLSDTIKRLSGNTASFHIHQRIIRAAKRAAAGSRTSMKEVAYQVGFNDIAHFSKFFRTQTGINFTDYKKLLI